MRPRYKSVDTFHFLSQGLGFQEKCHASHATTATHASHASPASRATLAKRPMESS